MTRWTGQVDRPLSHREFVEAFEGRKPRRSWKCFFCSQLNTERRSECVGCYRVRREA